MLTIGSDITEQKHNQEFLESISIASPLAIYIMQDDILKYTNQQFLSLTGYDQQELSGTDLLNIVAGADKDVVRVSTLQTLKREKAYPCEFRILHKNGEVRWVMQMVAPVYYENREAILGSLMDITERKYLERKVIEYEELDKMKGDILSTVSHELRTPLAAIKGYTTMMLDHRSRISPEETLENLVAINASADNLNKLVDNLLDTSWLDSGMLELKKSPSIISTLVKSWVKTASARINSHRITAVLPASLPRVNINKQRILQVLDNLLFNAVENSPPGTEIMISAVKKDRSIEIRVNDRGPVIPANELKSIFDRMYKLENREYGSTKGIGLGLHICQRLIEAHGGHIMAESEPVSGTTIIFSIPIIHLKKRWK
jgi:PAS domain S-box-containing protein